MANTAPAKHWLLRIVPQRKYGKLIVGVAIFAVLYPLFYLGVRGDFESRTPAFFFSVVIAYIIPVFNYITEKAEEAMRELRPLLDLDDSDFENTYSHLSCARPQFVAIQLGGGAFMGIVHWLVLEGSITGALRALTESTSSLLSATGTVLTWVVLTSVIYMLIVQAGVFARLGKTRVRATPFNVRSLTPFARVSISASLATIGAMALLPLIGLEGGANLKEILPGAFAMLAPLVAIFLLPVWPLHRRLASMKQRNLIEVDQRITQSLDARGYIEKKPENSERLNLLLTYRRELEECATWPFDVSNFGRLALYLVLVPLTWVAAALIENLVDSVL